MLSAFGLAASVNILYVNGCLLNKEADIIQRSEVYCGTKSEKGTQMRVGCYIVFSLVKMVSIRLVMLALLDQRSQRESSDLEELNPGNKKM
jgi:hypothetical protein